MILGGGIEEGSCGWMEVITERRIEEGGRGNRDGEGIEDGLMEVKGVEEE